MHLDRINLVGLEVVRAVEPNIKCAQLYDIHYIQGPACGTKRTPVTLYFNNRNNMKLNGLKIEFMVD